MPPTALGHAGIYPHKNELGVVAAMMVLLGLWALKAGSRFERLTALPLVALGIVFLIASRSKTSLGLAVLAPLLAAAALSGRHWLRVSPALSVPGALATAFLVYWAGAVSWVWDFHAVANALFGDPTLTLRTDIWSFAYEMAGARPLTGYGYEVFWGAGPSSPNQIYGEGFVRKVVHAHNGYLDTVVHLGLVGLAIVLVMMLDALLQAGRRFCSEPGAAFGQSTLLVFLMLYNLLEVTWFRSFSITSMAFVAIVASVVLVPPKPVGRLFRVADFKRYRWVPASAA